MTASYQIIKDYHIIKVYSDESTRDTEIRYFIDEDSNEIELEIADQGGSVYVSAKELLAVLTEIIKDQA